LWTESQATWSAGDRIDARRAKAVLKMQINKSDRNDAAGIARIMQTGWFKEVCVKDLDSHSVKALLASRALLELESRLGQRHQPATPGGPAANTLKFTPAFGGIADLAGLATGSTRS
jgi:transposase